MRSELIHTSSVIAATTQNRCISRQKITTDTEIRSQVQIILCNTSVQKFLSKTLFIFINNKLLTQNQLAKVWRLKPFQKHMQVWKASREVQNDINLHKNRNWMCENKTPFQGGCCNANVTQKIPYITKRSIIFLTTLAKARRLSANAQYNSKNYETFVTRAQLPS